MFYVLVLPPEGNWSVSDNMLVLVNGSPLLTNMTVLVVQLTSGRLESSHVDTLGRYVQPCSMCIRLRRAPSNLYNERQTRLQMAHRRLDDAVLDAYGWPHELAEEDILERLLALNMERAARQGTGGTPAPRS